MERAEPHEFPGTDRFSLLRCLGQGGMGAVYEVFDKERGERVALKTLLRAELSEIQRMKREFRALGDLSHPHLIQLYELMSVGSLWFFTMELVEGTDLVSWVRPASHGADPAWIPEQSQTLPSVPSSESFAAPPFRLDRLRAAFAELVDALNALHGADRLHRDIKPSNVLVTHGGRVVLLDFGLVTDTSKDWFDQSTVFRMAGTPGYMSPEQFAGEPLGPASDWYSVGLVLYQALTGRVPHLTEARHLLELARQRRDVAPPPPSALCPDVPEDLDRLCLALLRHDPAERPQGRDLARALRPLAAEAGVASASSAFIGRERELGELEQAFARTLEGKAAVEVVYGASGMGKSALVQYFLDRVVGSGRAVILRGRCYERESVPYKALDSLVDELARYWHRLPPEQAEGLVPLEVSALARLFPAFESVRAIAKRSERHRGSVELRELRRRAVSALRELFVRITDRSPLVLCIDDVQWGDVDSARLLSEILNVPEPPPCLFLLTCRSEDRAGSAFLRALSAGRLPAPLRELEIAPLPESAARELALSQLPRGQSALARAIAAEAGGSPFIVGELVRYAVKLGEQGGPTDGAAMDLRLEPALRSRVSELPEDADRLLRVVALASGPIRETVACRAAGIQERGQSAVLTLRNARLIRSCAGDDGFVEAYHDRIRETVTGDLDAGARRGLHERLAAALRDSEDADPEALGYHFRAAGMLDAARDYAKQAARDAAQGLAFDRAARLCRLALELLAPEDADAHALRVSLAEALRNLGRSPEAAEVYLDAAARAPDDEARRLRQAAAEQLLLSGHVDAGLATTKTVLESLGTRPPATRNAALGGLLWSRLRLRLRGIRFRERAAADVSPSALGRIDTFWAIGLYMSSIDPLRGAYFQAKNLLLALAAGEPLRVARALSVEASYRSTAGRRELERATALLDAARALSQRLEHPYLLGILGLAEGIVAFMAEERWKKCGELCQRSEAIFRENCRAVTWELSNSKFFYLNSLLLRGELAALAAELPDALKSAQDNGDLFAESYLSLRFSPTIRLAEDSPERSAEELSELSTKVSAREFYLQHYWERLANVQRLLYAGDARAALAALDTLWSRLPRGLILRMQFNRIELLHLHARCRLAVSADAGAGSERSRLLVEAERDAAALAKEATMRATSLAALVRGGAASARGDLDRAAAEFYSAADAFDAAGMGLHAAVARWTHGRVIRGERGAELSNGAERWLTSQRVARPERLSAMLVPGLPAKSR